MAEIGLEGGRTTVPGLKTGKTGPTGRKTTIPGLKTAESGPDGVKRTVPGLKTGKMGLEGEEGRDKNGRRKGKGKVISKNKLKARNQQQTVKNEQ